MYFYPRSPCGERPILYFVSPLIVWISIHALLAESDHYGWSWYDDFTEFLSTLSLRRATWSVDVPGWILGISIHALLAESDR